MVPLCPNKVLGVVETRLHSALAMPATLAALDAVFQAFPALCPCEPRIPRGEMQAVPCGARSNDRLLSPSAFELPPPAGIRSVRKYIPGYVEIMVEDTECPLQVCQLSRSSESNHFRFLRKDVALFVPPESPGQLLRSEARASDLLPNFPEYKTPTLLYKTHPNDLKFGYLQAFRGRILTLAHPDQSHMQKYARFGETPVPRTRP